MSGNGFWADKQQKFLKNEKEKHTSGIKIGRAPQSLKKALREGFKPSSKFGSPLILPSGKERWGEFHELVTDILPMKKAKDPWKVDLKKQAEVLAKRLKTKSSKDYNFPNAKYILPRNFCPMCNETDRPLDGGSFSMMVVPHPPSGWKDCKGGEQVTFCICQKCVEEVIQKSARQD